MPRQERPLTFKWVTLLGTWEYAPHTASAMASEGRTVAFVPSTQKPAEAQLSEQDYLSDTDWLSVRANAAVQNPNAFS